MKTILTYLDYIIVIILTILIFGPFIKASIIKIKQMRHINLCDTCKLHIAECKPKYIKFGTGIGNYNVIKCSKYQYKTNTTIERWTNKHFVTLLVALVIAITGLIIVLNMFDC